MNPFIFLSWLAPLFLILLCVIVVASLRPSRLSYQVALGCYTVALPIGLLALAAPGVFLLVMMGVIMRPEVQVGVGVAALIIIAVVAYPLVSLYPFMSERAARTGRSISFASTGLMAAGGLIYFAGSGSLGGMGPLGVGEGMLLISPGLVAVFHLLVWLRVYDLRTAAMRAGGPARRIPVGRTVTP